MIHARRKFTDAPKSMKKPGGPPLQALAFFEALYKVEKLARESSFSEGDPSSSLWRRYLRTA